VEAEDIASRRKEKEMYDMVVLATGIIPANGVPGMQKNEDGFYTAVQPSGIFTAGCATRPLDVAATVKDVTGVALRAMQ